MLGCLSARFRLQTIAVSATVPPAVDLLLDGTAHCDTGRGIILAYQSFGRPSDPLLLLIMGLSGQMIDWPDRFCQLLADRGSCVWFASITVMSVSPLICVTIVSTSARCSPRALTSQRPHPTASRTWLTMRPC